MYDPSDDYYEPNAIDQAVSDFRKAVHASIKTEIADEMNRLTDENRALRAKFNNLEDLEQSARAREAQAERAIGEASLEARRMRFDELVEGLTRVVYGVSSSGERLPKCDKCDENRYIKYKTPSGREATELCACANYRDEVVVDELEVVEADIRYGKIMYWHSAGRGDDSYIKSKVYKDPEKDSLEKVIDQYYAYRFLDRDMAQKVANLVNERRKAEAENASDAETD
jgi:transposase-like protein